MALRIVETKRRGKRPAKAKQTVKRVRKKKPYIVVENIADNTSRDELASPRIQVSHPEPAPSPLWLVLAIALVLIGIYLLVEFAGHP